jgi:hypothetical protein
MTQHLPALHLPPGTLTHMAPELLIPDALADASVDVSGEHQGEAKG